MAKFHELLAVEGDLKSLFEKMLEEGVTTFTKRVDHFTGHNRTLKMHDEKRAIEEAGQEENKDLTSTVDEKLDWVWGHITKFIDARSQKELTNTTAKADLVVNGETLAKDLPATLLLSLEDILKKIRHMYESVPTLPPGMQWTPDTDQRPGVFKSAEPEKRLKSEKDFKFRVLQPPTDKHPAQIEKWTDDVPVGTYTTVKYNGCLSVADKSDRLSKIDTLLAAVKTARQRANDVDVKFVEVGKKFEAFING